LRSFPCSPRSSTAALLQSSSGMKVARTVALQSISLLVTFLALSACQATHAPAPLSSSPSALPRERALAAPPIVLAEGVASPSLPAALAWVADEVTLGAERATTHSHEAAFVYAPVTPSRLTVAGQPKTLRPGEAAFVGDNVVHTHDRTCVQPTDCRDSFWEIRLARPTARPASGDLETKRVFVSSTLEPPLEGPLPVRFEMLR